MSPNSGRIRLAVIGAGNIAPVNVQGYLQHERCDVVAVCDPIEAKARHLADSWGVDTVFTDLDELLSDPGIDAVEILTPTHLHHDHVLAALAAGKHVSCQKPVANTIEDGRAMEAAATEHGVTLRISECFRHYPPLEQAKELIEAGAIGQLSNVRIRTIVGTTDSQFQADLQPEGYIWRLDSQSPGGHLFDDNVHKYAMALWLAGQDVTSVQAIVRRRDFFLEPCVAIFEYEEERLLGSMEVSYAPSMSIRSSYYGADEFFEIQGDEGFIWVTRCTGEMLDLAPVLLFQGKGGNGSMREVPVIDANWGSGFDRSAAHFIDSLLAGTTPDMTADEAVKVLQLCFAVYEAGNTGQRVDPRTIKGSVSPTGWAAW
ncbi:MAG: Gfo/Idh/MocA family oxidoreductase [Acidimicrobiales bacterium]